LFSNLIFGLNQHSLCQCGAIELQHYWVIYIALELGVAIKNDIIEQQALKECLLKLMMATLNFYNNDFHQSSS
jgi:hypothetical protein